MKVFHGTNVVIERPGIMNRFKTLDFGEGFYTTENENQARDFAVKVCKRRNPPFYPIVNCYEFNEEFYKSNLFDKLQNPDTGLWHLSSKTLSEMFLTEVKEQIIEFPEEQS